MEQPYSSAAQPPARDLVRAPGFDVAGARIAGSVRAFDDLIDRAVTRIAYCPCASEPVPDTPYRVVRVPRPGLPDVLIYFTVTPSACVLEFAAVGRKPA